MFSDSCTYKHAHTNAEENHASQCSALALWSRKKQIPWNHRHTRQAYLHCRNDTSSTEAIIYWRCQSAREHCAPTLFCSALLWASFFRSFTHVFLCHIHRYLHWWNYFLNLTCLCCLNISKRNIRDTFTCEASFHKISIFIRICFHSQLIIFFQPLLLFWM